jgi:general secretion pathway protein J
MMTIAPRRVAAIVGESGFSLIEVVIALFITATLAGLGSSLVLGTLAGKERFDAAANGARGVELAHAALKSDLSQIAARVVRAPGGEPRGLVFTGGPVTGDAPLLGFARAGWDNPGGAEPRGSVVYVEYVHDEDRLVRRSWVRADATTRTPVTEWVLLTGVQSVEASFGRVGVWTPTFASSPDGERRAALPALVTLDLDIAGVGLVRQVFATGYGR